MEVSAPRSAGLSPRARAILGFIARVQAKQGAPPTLREIGRRFGIRSTNGVRYHIDRLERAGALRRRPGRARGLTLRGVPRAGTPGDRPVQIEAPRVPVLGRIAAGKPMLSAENIEGSLGLPGTSSAAPDFALRVTGESMREAGILEGDLVLVRQDPTPRNGEIVVAMIGDETTVKRFFRRGRQVVLEPENPAYAPIVVTERSPELRILGRVVGVYRDLG